MDFSETIAACDLKVGKHRRLINKNIIMSSFKSSRYIQKKKGGPVSCFG